MARLYLFAEGPTEQTFADTVLKPYLANCGVYMQGPILIAHARKKGRVHRGGGRNFTAMQNDIKRFLKQESGNEVFFTTMIDLYALHKNFPGLEEAEQLRHAPYTRVEALERAWSDETRDRRFIPFIQLHEFEAYLFSDVSRVYAFFFDNPEFPNSLPYRQGAERCGVSGTDQRRTTHLTIQADHCPISRIRKIESHSRPTDCRTYWLGDHPVQMFPLYGVG